MDEEVIQGGIVVGSGGQEELGKRLPSYEVCESFVEPKVVEGKHMVCGRLEK
jgi:hypothetical protein